MIDFLPIIAPVLISIFLLVIFFYLRKKRSFPRPYTPLERDGDPPFEYLQDTCLENIPTHELQSLLNRAQLKGIVLIHGTFIGDDPLTLIRAAESILSRHRPINLNLMRRMTKGQTDLILQEKANFTKHYINELEGLCPGIPIKRFVWTSSNHHLARLKGAMELNKFLIKEGLNQGPVLFLCHSHGSQLPILLSSLQSNANLYAEIAKLFKKHNTANSFKLSSLKGPFWVNTLGAPPRYEMGLEGAWSFVHFSNHRKETTQGVGTKGVMQTKFGDYIQLWGSPGSDFISASQNERHFNRDLDSLLGKGIDGKTWWQHLDQGNRFQQWGHHYLVDYGDDTILPLGPFSIFGHGIYTSKKLIPFHLYYGLKKFLG